MTTERYLAILVVFAVFGVFAVAAWVTRGSRKKEKLTLEEALKRIEKSRLKEVSQGTDSHKVRTELSNGWVKVFHWQESASMGLLTFIQINAHDYQGTISIKAKGNVILSINNRPPEKRDGTPTKILAVIQAAVESNKAGTLDFAPS